MAINDANWAIGSTGSGWENYFYRHRGRSGDLWPSALTVEQVLAHYNAAVSGLQPPVLGIALVGGAVTLTWNNGVLQEADSAGGAYKSLPDAKSPYSPTLTSGAKYYGCRTDRLRPKLSIRGPVAEMLRAFFFSPAARTELTWAPDSDARFPSFPTSAHALGRMGVVCGSLLLPAFRDPRGSTLPGYSCAWIAVDVLGA